MIKVNPKSPWLTPFNPQVMGGLRGKISQYADGSSTILTPRSQPTRSKTGYSYLTIPIIQTT